PVIPVHVSPVATEPSRLVFFYEPSGDEATLLALQDSLIERGAYHVNVFPPSHIACMLPDKIDAGEAAAFAGAIAVEDRRIAALRTESAVPGVEFLRQCYDLAKRVADPEDEPFLELPAGAASPGNQSMIIEAAPEEMGAREPASDGPDGTEAEGAVVRRFYQNSEMLLGRIVVNIITPESSFWWNTENWTEERLSSAEQGATAALLSYQQQFPYASINFIVRWNMKVPTYYEPIQTEIDDHGDWINDVLRRINGKYYYPSEPPYVVVDKLNRDRLKYYNADWVFTVFICSAFRDADHAFLRELTTVSYGMFGGPYLVCPFPAGNYYFHPDESYRLAVYLQHEIGHIFWALDEDLYAKGDCHNRSGYLNLENKNKIDRIIMGGPANTCDFDIGPCAMQSTYGTVCEYTAAHMGFCDLDENAIPDVFDSPPVVEFAGGVAETVVVDTFTIRGKVISVPIPNQNYKQDSTYWINYSAPLKDAVININGFGNLYFLPEDERWDEVEEDLVIPLTDLPVGMTVVELKVRNSAGCESQQIVKRIFRAGLSYSLFTANAADNGVALTWYMVGDTFDAIFDLYRVDFNTHPPDTTLLATGLEPSGPPEERFLPFAYFDPDIEPMQTYGYFIRGTYELSIQGEPPKTFVTDSKLFKVTAPLPIDEGDMMSAFTPNPFSAETHFSLRVPQTFEKFSARSEGRGESGGSRAPGLIKEIPTSVKITAYDVMGRYVATVLKERYYGTTVTLAWNGTTDNNEPVPSGVYFLKIAVGQAIQTKQVTILR
ncbi:MAG: hypothetical protein HY770_04275, partial [Chitinivibrionia bacterium]|nr:hypothetical protein [Chitinivibrionia bacterium]